MLLFEHLIAGQQISWCLYDAIRKVETGGEQDPENAVGDGGGPIITG